MHETPRGRPRDPQFEDRVYDAALSLYATSGLAGVTIAAIARTAQVGKASIYMRWPDPDRLLNDALAARIVLDTQIDTQDLREDLNRLGGQMLGLFDSDAGLAYMRRLVDRTLEPGRFDNSTGANPTIVAARRLVRAAIDRGELRADASPTLVLEMLFGGTLMHALSTPTHLRDQALGLKSTHLTALVDSILRAFGPPCASEVRSS